MRPRSLNIGIVALALALAQGGSSAWGAAAVGAADSVATDPAPAAAHVPTLRQGHRTAADSTYLVEFAGRSDVVTLPSGLEYQVVQSGDGVKPRDTDTVRLNYRGTLVGGIEFGASAPNGGGAAKSVRVAALIPGLRAAVLDMRVGAHWIIVVPPALGFDSGSPLYRRTTIFDVSLAGIEPSAQSR